MGRDDTESLLSVAQAAALLGVHPNTIRAWTDAGRLAAYRINSRGDRRYRRRDVERLLVEDGAPSSTVPGSAARAIGAGLVVKMARGFSAALSADAVSRVPSAPSWVPIGSRCT
jgi:excisionase family DNA binding protein